MQTKTAKDAAKADAQPAGAHEPLRPRRKLIVIHGLGGTFAEAVTRIRGLLAFECVWHEGAFFVDRRMGTLLRHILNQNEPDQYLRALQTLVLSRFAEAPIGGNSVDTDRNRASRFAETQLIDEFLELGIPLAPDKRRVRAAQLRREAERILAPLEPALRAVERALQTSNGAGLTEREARATISAADDGAAASALLGLLETARDHHETGGDLDTVASATLYTHWLRGRARAERRDCLYGRDYRYVFVNYHDSLRFLEAYGPGDVLMADVPIGALPFFEDDVRALATAGVTFERYEDHHPYSTEQHIMLERLKREGLLGYFGMSGPLLGEDIAPGTARCGTDMVYDSTIRDQPWDSAGAQHLRRVTHAEDLAGNREELGKNLTGLIKGGICKVELAQLLVDALDDDTIDDRLARSGWLDRLRNWEADFQSVAEDLLDSTSMLTFRRPPPDSRPEDLGGVPLCEGSDMPRPRPTTADDADDAHVRVLMALAISAHPDRTRIPVGRAVEFLSHAYPDVDYIFYCYGSSLLVARRVNQADLTFNLGALMPRIGGPGDGGHSGAAVCRPEDNPDYPARLLGRITRANFCVFSRYLGERIAETGIPLAGQRDRSRASSISFGRGRSTPLFVTVAAVIVGILLIALSAKFRRPAIRESNATFYPQLQTGDDESAYDDAEDPAGENQP